MLFGLTEIMAERKRQSKDPVSCTASKNTKSKIENGETRKPQKLWEVGQTTVWIGTRVRAVPFMGYQHHPFWPINGLAQRNNQKSLKL